jgi:hypothetical protein
MLALEGQGVSAIDKKKFSFYHKPQPWNESVSTCAINIDSNEKHRQNILLQLSAVDSDLLCVPIQN